MDGILIDATQSNRSRKQQREAAHLPDTYEDAVPFFRQLVAKHHSAMCDGNAASVVALRAEAHRLATKLNDYQPGILANEDAPGCRLDRAIRGADGAIPQWGQSGTFEIHHDWMPIQIDMDGIFGIGATAMNWLGFSVRVLDRSRPFLSETGYRSFLGVGGDLRPGYTPDTFAAAIIAAYIKHTLKNRLVRIKTSGGKPVPVKRSRANRRA